MLLLVSLRHNGFRLFMVTYLYFIIDVTVLVLNHARHVERNAVIDVLIRNVQIYAETPATTAR